MMKTKAILTLYAVMLFTLINAQQYSFDAGTTAPFTAVEPAKSRLSLVDAPYKDGNSALEWSWTSATSLLVDYQVTLKNFRDGVIFWVYNETPVSTPLTAEFRDGNNQVRYTFSFGLNYSGWRICRIGSRYMSGNKSVSTNLKLYLKTPTGINQGRLFIDRFSYASDVGYQNAPDAQQPTNNETQYINHWNSLWKWESQLTYDIAAPASLSPAQSATLNTIEAGILKRLPQAASASAIASAKTLFASSNIRKEGTFWVGSPMVVKPDKTATDISLVELGTMMNGLALDAVFNSNTASEQQYVDLWDFALSQGFAYGSAMGNNHHYGYETRQIFQAAYLMREVLKTTGRINEVADALSFWSGLPESRRPFDMVREGVVDLWNTLLFPRLIAAMLIQDMPQRYRAVQSLVRWVDTSFAFTPGNLGGFKRDGSVFHHAGHYPAYAVGGFQGIGDFIATLPGSGFGLSLNARTNLADALIAMSRYTHQTDWSTGMSGRHPHQGGMTSAVIEAFGLLALNGGVYNTAENIDSKLAAEFLRLETENTALKQQLSNFTAAPVPSGFFVFNHAAAGVHRFGTAMVTIKGYNSDVWGSEIYTNDNRYGRYQSYGAIEIFNEGTPVTRSSSRFNEAGWDWNRLPGTTTIQLPLNLLESPSTGTLMARSKEDFAGASALAGQYGIFGMKLREENLINNTNYTPDFVARKSVFVFGKRLVCVGTQISNSNANYSTQTNLYQQSINFATERIAVNGVFNDAQGFNFDSQSPVTPTVISDLSGNYYRVANPARVIIEGKEQISRHNKTRAETKGNFLTARIEHGKKPSGAGYEYMIMLKPTPAEQRRWSDDPAYRILRADDIAHIVLDTISGVTGYVAFQEVQPVSGLLRKITAETLVMTQLKNASTLMMSVCDPSLRLPEKTSNSDVTLKESAELIKTLQVEGEWKLNDPQQGVSIAYINGQTNVSVACRFGLPVEFELVRINTRTTGLKEDKLKLIPEGSNLLIAGETRLVSIYNASGQKIASQEYFSEHKTFFLTRNKLYLMVALLPDSTYYSRKLLL